MNRPLIVAADEEGVAQAAAAVRAGRIVAYLTDTVYALAADPTNHEALARLVAVKGREPDKPSPLIAADLRQVEMLATLNEPAARLAAIFWPGPLTLVLRGRSRMEPVVMNPDGGIGIRIPDRASARRLAESCGFPITATSANRSGDAPGQVAAAVLDRLEVDLVVDGGRAKDSVPSTVLDVSTESAIVIREGAIAVAALEKALGSSVRRPD